MNSFESTIPIIALVLVAVVLAVAGIAVAVSKNGMFDRLNNRLERRKTLSIVIFGILSEVILGGGIMAAINCQSNAIAQAQLEIAERENDPLLTLEGKEAKGDEALYTLSNEKGMASYASLLVRGEFTIFIDGAEYELDIAFDSKPKSSRVSIESEESAEFSVVDHGFDPEKMEYAISECLEQKYDIENPIVRHNHIVEANCFDRSNQKVGFRFRLVEGGYSFVGLSSTKRFPEHNVTSYWSAEGLNPYEQADSLLETLLDR